MRAEGFGLRVACHRFPFPHRRLVGGEKQSGSKRAAVQRKALPDDMIVGPAKHLRPGRPASPGRMNIVRLKPEKVENLSRQIVAAMEKDERVVLLSGHDEIERAVRRLFLEDLEREDELMKEVDQIMETHRAKISGKNIDVQVLRRKIRDQLVRERKIVL